MGRPGLTAIVILCALAFTYHAGRTRAEEPGRGCVDLPILQRWEGDLQVSRLDHLPQGQRNAAFGYIGDAKSFDFMWRVFRPGEETPLVNFDAHLVLFYRNLRYYNRNSIAKVTVEEGVVEIVVMETMSALPIIDKVGLSLAVIPRSGLRFIEAVERRIPVQPNSGPVYGDLNDDGLKDEVLLGDRIAYRGIDIRNGDLIPVKPLARGEQVLGGWVVLGHEIRSFTPCSGESTP
jgi:hypothetical protein